MIPAAKATGQYVNSVLAKIEVAKAGYEEAILLDDRGMVCEGSGENLFIVKRRRHRHAGLQRRHPRRHQPRRRSITIARDLGYEVVERDVARGELYLADEIFMTGTAAELTPLREVDDRPVGDRRAGRDHAHDPARVRGRAARPLGALRGVARRRAPRRRPPREPDRRSTTAPCATACRGRACRSRRRRSCASRTCSTSSASAGRGRLPGLEPEGGRAVRAARARDVPHGGDRRVRDDAAARRAPPTTTRRCALLAGVVRAGLHARRQDVEPAPGEGRARRPRREPAHDRGVRRASSSGEGKTVVYDAEHFFDAWRDDREYALRCARAAAEAGAAWVTLCDTNGASLPHEVEAATRRGRRRARRAGRHPLPQRRRVRRGELARRGARRARAWCRAR